MTLAVVALLTAGAFWIRVTDLARWDGTLSVDEARLAMAARGVLQHGVPMLETGWVYTRGLLASYTVALSFAVLGSGDFAARLPSVVAGAALVPIMFLFGRRLGGAAGGLFAAAYVAGYPPLVVWSRQAWLFSLYVLLFAAAVLFIVRAHQSRRPLDQLLAGALVGLTLFAHELGIFLLIPLVAQAALAIATDRGHTRRTGAAIAALAVAGGCIVALALLVTSLRGPTLAGPYGEIGEYFSPHLEGVPFRFYGRMLVDGRGLMLATALLGIPIAVLVRRAEPLLLWLALAPGWLHAVTVIPERPQERYGLTFAVVMVGLAVASASSWGEWAAQRRLVNPSRVRWLVPAALALMLIVHQDVARAIDRGALSPRDGAWLREARGLGITADNVVLSDVPTVVGWYVGGLDYWITSQQFQKYAIIAGEQRRDIHTGATIVRTVSDFQRLVALPRRGETVWVIASGRPFQWGELVDDELKTFIERSASRRVVGADGSRIYRIDL